VNAAALRSFARDCFAAYASVQDPRPLLLVIAALVGVGAYVVMRRWPARGPRLAFAALCLMGVACAAVLSLAAWRYARNPEVLDIVESQVVSASIESNQGFSVYEIAPARRMVGIGYGPLAYWWWKSVAASSGASIAAMKVTNALLLAVAAMLVAGAAWLLAGGAAAAGAAALALLTVSSLGSFYLTIRTDNLIMVVASLAMLLAAAHRRWHAGWLLAAAAIVAGAVAAIKPHHAVVAAAVTALIALDGLKGRAMVRRLVVMMGCAALGAIGGGMLLGHDAGNSTGSLMRLAAAIKIQAAMLPANFAATGAPLAGLLLLAGRRLKGDSEGTLLVLGATGAVLLVLVIGAGDGAGVHHALVALFMCIPWAALEWRRGEAARRAALAGALATGVALLLCAVQLLPSLLWQTRGQPAVSGLWLAEGRDLIRASAGRVGIVMGVDDRASTRAVLLGPSLVAAGAHDIANVTSVMQYRLWGPRASTLDSLPASPLVDAWLVPRGAVPFASANWHSGQGDLYSEVARRVFASTFQPACRGAYWELWTRRTWSAPVRCPAN
jgi:hypothetical protein